MIRIVPFPEVARGFTVYRPTTPHPLYTQENEVRLLIWLAKQTAGAMCEMGCCYGVTTFNLAARFPLRTIAGIDWCGNPTMRESQRKEQPTIDELCVFAGWMPNVAIYNLNLQTDLHTHSRRYGFIFIDADHQYEAVKANTNSALRLISPGGIIAWHDYPVEPRGPKADWIGVPRLLNELSDGGMDIQACEGTMVAWTRVP